jgi:hypothetical protein
MWDFKLVGRQVIQRVVSTLTVLEVLDMVGRDNREFDDGDPLLANEQFNLHQSQEHSIGALSWQSPTVFIDPSSP